MTTVMSPKSQLHVPIGQVVDAGPYHPKSQTPQRIREYLSQKYFIYQRRKACYFQYVLIVCMWRMYCLLKPWLVTPSRMLSVTVDVFHSTQSV